MSANALKQPGSAMITKADIAYRLLYSAYERKLFNVLMTFAATLLMGISLFKFLPINILILWVFSILVGAGLGFVELMAFQKTKPGPEKTPFWEKIFFLQSAAAGFTWSLVPCLMISDSSGTLLTLFATIFLVVCVVATISTVEQPKAMAAFIVALLMPPVFVLGYSEDSMRMLEALALFIGMLSLIAVGYQLHKNLRDLMEGQWRTRAILDTAFDGIIQIDGRGRITDWNTRSESMFGMKKDDVIGLKVNELIVPQRLREMYWQNLNQYIEGIKKGDNNRRFEMVLTRKNGDEFSAELRSSSLQIGSEWRYTGFIADITERKRAEDALQENREKYRALSEAASQAIFISEKGKCLEQNKRAQEMFGYSDAEALGRMGTEWIAPQDRDLVMNHMISGYEQPYEAIGLRKDGSKFPAILRGKMMEYKGMAVRVTIMEDVTERKRFEMEERIAATAFESQQGIIITDAQRVILRVNKAFTQITGYSAEEAIGQSPRMLLSDQHDSAFYTFIRSSLELNGVWSGEMISRRKNGEDYPEWLSISAVRDDFEVTTHYVAIFSDISERVRAQEQIDALAFYDTLTLLPNRRLFLDRLQQVVHVSTLHQRNNALLFIDLDNFKMLNDTLGHQQGDLLLTQVAQRLKTCINEGDTLARVGGDEFVVMLENLSEDSIEAASQAEAIATQLLDIFTPVFILDDGAHHFSSSIGIALFGRSIVDSFDHPLQRAELAMFQAKESGRNRLRFFDGHMQEKISARAMLEADLHEALQKQQFELFYQPQMVGSGRMVGVEALLRWFHPLRGIVLPNEFISLAEETGLILPIGQWVLDTACAQLTNWANDPIMSQLTIAVNVSALQFQHADFVDMVLTTLDRTKAKPNLLKLELTESMLLNNVEDIIVKMQAIKNKGVQFSLDDFGTGYSSLSYLKRLPLSQLKIDQSFIRNIVTDPNDAAIAKMVVALAEGMGLAVIAEGVEMQAQADLLAHLGCYAYQGYLFSRPLPLNELEEFVKKGI